MSPMLPLPALAQLSSSSSSSDEPESVGRSGMFRAELPELLALALLGSVSGGVSASAAACPLDFFLKVALI